MKIIPAIDILDGKCVRLTKGKFDNRKIYSSDPLAVAKNFERQGAKMLHIVDLNAAKTGRPVNKELILRIAQTLNIPIEVGGGIRNIEIARTYLNTGVQKIIIGTKAVKDPLFLISLIKEFDSERIIVAVETKKDKITINGWQKTTGKNYLDFAKELKTLGVTEILFTDVEKDGSLTEPNFEAIKKLVKLGFKIRASGGISDLMSIKKLEKLGASAVILGKALYENKIILRDALKEVAPVSNLTKRIIPCLDVKNGRVVKGVLFENLQIAGDPVKLGKKYSDEGADELVFLDIMASKENRETLSNIAKKVAKKINIPFTVGGGVKTIEEIQKLLYIGADKVSINTAAVLNPDFITKASLAFGQQCIVVAIDVKRKNGKYKVFLKGGTEETPLEAVWWAKEAEKRGAGEILLTSMDKDGTKTGYDLKLLKMVSEAVKIPVIASGGAGSLIDLKSAFDYGKVDAVLIASLFHYENFSINQVKKYLSANNVPIRI